MWHSRPVTDYRDDNRANWDERVPAHVASAVYCVPRFRAEPDYLSDVVQFDRPLLGDIAGLRGVHLQCHIGTDTVSLARLGASMTGLDFSGPAVAAATRLAAATGADATFVQSDVYAAADVLGAGAFDLVYTGIGALCWLPDIRRWAGVVAALLRPGGRLFIREGHPMLWTIDGARRRPAGREVPVLRAAGAAHLDRGRHLRGHRPGLHAERQPRVEPRPRRDRHRPPRRRPRAHRPGRARQRPVERLPRQDGADRGERVAARRPPGPAAHSYTLQAVKPPR